MIGRFDDKPLPPQRPHRARPTTSRSGPGYEVVLDVFPDVIAYGILLLPKDIKPGEQRPVVVCQHGLEGRPQRRDGRRTTQYYHDFAARAGRAGLHRLRPAEPVHLPGPLPHAAAQGQPAGEDALLDHRAAAPADRRLARRRCRRSIRERIAFYGLSYGGKTAMRDPAAGDELLPVDLLGRLQRMGLEERLDAGRRTATCGRASTRSSSSTWAARSTTPRWPP